MKRYLAAALLLLCAACAQNRIDEDSRHAVRKLAIVAIAPPRQVVIENRNAASFLLPGAIAQGARTDKNSAAYVAEMNSRKKLLAPELAQYLKDGLSGRYEVAITNQRPAIKDQTVDYSSIKVDADAILNVFYGHTGYISLDTENDYLPVVVIGARMVDARTYKTLYYRQFIVQPQANQVKASSGRIAIEADRSYAYPNSAALLSSFDRSYEGLVKSQEAIAKRIIGDLASAHLPEPDK